MNFPNLSINIVSIIINLIQTLIKETKKTNGKEWKGKETRNKKQETILLNLEELLFILVRAFPNASNTGFANKNISSTEGMFCCDIPLFISCEVEVCVGEEESDKC